MLAYILISFQGHPINMARYYGPFTAAQCHLVIEKQIPHIGMMRQLKCLPYNKSLVDGRSHPHQSP